MYICVWVSTLYQARGVSSHVYVCVGIKLEESVVKYMCVCVNQARRVSSHVYICVCRYQARGVSSHVYVCVGTKPEE